MLLSDSLNKPVCSQRAIVCACACACVCVWQRCGSEIVRCVLMRVPQPIAQLQEGWGQALETATSLNQVNNKELSRAPGRRGTTGPLAVILWRNTCVDGYSFFGEGRRVGL